MAAKLTRKGQITVPMRVREALGVHPGDRLAFRIRDDGVVTVEPENVDLRALRGIVKPTIRSVTVDDMNAAVRKAGSRQ